MAISPYSTPLQYEYKPLNLSGFITPLSNMQEKFDITTAQVEEAKDLFNVAHLPFGTDPEKAKELIAIAQGKVDELAQNLATTKNYKQATSKLKELNNLWNKDPHKQALESNAKQFEKRKAEELERVKKNEITETYYNQWLQDEIRKYEAKGFANFKADYTNEDGTYNRFTGDTGRIEDKTEKLRDLSMKAAAAMKGNASEGYYKSIGIDKDTFTKHFAKTNIEELTQEEIAKDVERFLRTQPDFQDWAQEEAYYNFKDIENSTAYGNYAKRIVTNEKEEIDAYLLERQKQLKKEGKAVDKDATYQGLLKEKTELEGMINSGNFENKKVEKLYTKQYLDNKFDMNAVGDLYEYRKVSTSEKGEKIDDDSELGQRMGTSKENKVIPFVGQVEDMKFDTPSIQKRIWDNAVSIKQTTSNLMNMSGGALRTLTLGKKSSSGIMQGVVDMAKKQTDPNYQSRTDIENNAGAQYERLTIIQQAVGKSNGDYKKFKQELKSRGIKDFDDATAKQVFEDLNDPKSTALGQLNRGLEKAQEAYSDYIINKNNIANIEKATYQTEDYKLATAKLSAGLGEVRQEADYDNPFGNTYTDPKFLASNYSKEDLRKKGIDPNKGTLNLNDFAKLKGYKNFDEAVKKGENFNGIKKSVRVNGVEYTGTIQEIKKQLIDATAKKGLTVEKMANKYINDTETEKELAGYFKTIEDATQRASAKELRGLPGFDKFGAPLSGTKIVKDYKPQIVTLGGESYFSIPYFYAETTEGKKKGQDNILIKAKPQDKMFLENVYDRVIKKAKNNTTGLGEETIASTRVALFNLRYGNDFNDAYANSPAFKVYDRPGDDEVKFNTISINVGGRTVPATIVKKHKRGGSTDFVYKIKYNDGSYMQGDFTTTDALKAAVIEYGE